MRVGVRVELPANQPILLLRETNGDRYLPIWIGSVEATAIALEQQGVKPARPLTHDLLKDVIKSLGGVGPAGGGADPRRGERAFRGWVDHPGRAGGRGREVPRVPRLRLPGRLPGSATLKSHSKVAARRVDR